MAKTAGEVTPNDRLLAGLAYLTGGLVGVLVLLADELRKRPYQKYHAVQSIVFNVAIWILVVVVYGVFTVVTFGIGALCGWVLFFVPIVIDLYFAYLAYQERPFTIPIVTDFVKNQGWV